MIARICAYMRGPDHACFCVFFLTAVMPLRYVRKGYVFYTYIYTLARSCIHVYAHMSKTQTCKNIYTETLSLLYTSTRSCPQMYAHIGANMPAHVCTQRRDHAHACMHTKARSCPRVYAHIGAIMPAQICTHERNHAHVCMHT